MSVVECCSCDSVIGTNPATNISGRLNLSCGLGLATELSYFREIFSDLGRVLSTLEPGLVPILQTLACEKIRSWSRYSKHMMNVFIPSVCLEKNVELKYLLVKLLNECRCPN